MHNSVTCSLRLKLEVSHDLCRSSSVFALDNLGRGGYARARLGEAQNLGPETHDRDWAAAEQRIASLRRITKTRNSVPSSQDSVTRGVQNLQISDTPAIQTARSAPAPPPMPNSRSPPEARSKQQPENIFGVRRVAQIPPLSEQSPTTASRCTWFRNTGDNHCFQKALVPSRPCGLYSLRHHQAAAMSPDDNPDTRVQRPMAGPPFSHLLNTRCCSQVTPPTTARFRTAPFETLSTERDKQLLAELRRASAMALPRCVVSRHATPFAESFEGAMSGHQSWAHLCRNRCRLLPC